MSKDRIHGQSVGLAFGRVNRTCRALRWRFSFLVRLDDERQDCKYRFDKTPTQLGFYQFDIRMNSVAAKNVVWFPSWPDALRQLHLPTLRRQQYRLALVRYLRFCKETPQRGWPVVVEYEGENAVAAVTESARYLRQI